MAYKQDSADLRNDLTSAVAVARERFAREAGGQLASMANVHEDMVWRVRRDDTLEGQVAAGYEPSTVQQVVLAFADVIGGTVTEWEATANLRGVETSSSFAGLTVVVWGTTYR